ncbi:hypothetical protein [Rhodococcus sp. NPDC058521]|uniref:hypothetical protein n=1 Tax=Rhodococcus sp. NPDC058521 TaxID=3346536 RepID=UPI00365E0200
MRTYGRTLITGAAMMGLAAIGTGTASADEPQIPPPEPTLTVFAASLGADTYSAVVGVEPDYVCKSDPAGTPIGAADDYGQALVGPIGLAGFSAPRTDRDTVGITCGPQFSEWSDTGTGTVFILN